jgi:tetratricopeptide (TPR) repeat protein
VGRDLIAWAKALAGELGDRVALTGVLRNSGYVELLAGDPVAAERELREGYEILEHISDLGHHASHAPDLGEAVYAQSRYEEAMGLAEFAEAVAILGDVDGEVRTWQLRAKCLAREGRIDDALAVVDRALVAAERTDYLDLVALTHVSHGEVLRLAGRTGEAASAVRAAVELFRRKGNEVLAARAASILEELEG